jgi:hypothetical protein
MRRISSRSDYSTRCRLRPSRESRKRISEVLRLVLTMHIGSTPISTRVPALRSSRIGVLQPSWSMRCGTSMVCAIAFTHGASCRITSMWSSLRCRRGRRRYDCRRSSSHGRATRRRRRTASSVVPGRFGSANTMIISSGTKRISCAVSITRSTIRSRLGCARDGRIGPRPDFASILTRFPQLDGGAATAYVTGP